MLSRIRRSQKEFPEVSPELLEKFSSWDSHLGWCNQPDSEKLDRSDRKEASKGNENLATFRTDQLGSRTPYEHEGHKINIACYGDSYCMSRDVEDNETWPWYLGQKLHARVSNYGVGNYGLDQAVLRMERDYEKDPANIVVLAVVCITMARAVSVFRHYLEPGNVLAIKPRFIINDAGDLQLLSYPCKDKNELRYLKSFKKFFRENDAHFEYWLKRKIGFPYFLRLFHDCNRLEVISWIVDKVDRVLGIKLGKRLGLKERLKDRRSRYELSFWRKEEDLFISILKRFAEFASSRDAIPVFLLQHQKRFLTREYKQTNELEWERALDRADQEIPSLHVIDSFSWISEKKNLDQLYRKSHHSPAGNELIAEGLANYFSNHSSTAKYLLT